MPFRMVLAIAPERVCKADMVCMRVATLSPFKGRAHSPLAMYCALWYSDVVMAILVIEEVISVLL